MLSLQPPKFTEHGCYCCSHNLLLIAQQSTTLKGTDKVCEKEKHLIAVCLSKRVWFFVTWDGRVMHKIVAKLLQWLLILGRSWTISVINILLCVNMTQFQLANFFFHNWRSGSHAFLVWRMLIIKLLFCSLYDPNIANYAFQQIYNFNDMRCSYFSHV